MGSSLKLQGLSTLIFKTPIWKWEVPGPHTIFRKAAQVLHTGQGGGGRGWEGALQACGERGEAPPSIRAPVPPWRALSAGPRFDIHLFSHRQSLPAPFPQGRSCEDPGALSTDEWFRVCVWDGGGGLEGGQTIAPTSRRGVWGTTHW